MQIGKMFNRQIALSYVLVLVALVALSLSLYIKSLKSDVAKLSAEKAEVSTRLETSLQSVTDLQSAIAKQNSAIQLLSDESKKREETNKVLLAKAKATADTYKKKANALRESKPEPFQSLCEAAEFLLNREIQDYE